MKPRFFSIRLLMMGLAALTLSGPASAGKQEPFKGTSSGVVTTVGFDKEAGISYTRVAGEGQSTQLGRFAVTAYLAYTVATGIARGVSMLTAANGDQLFLTMTGRGIDATHGQGTLTVVGGTGRFQGATGSFEQTITFAVAPGSTTSDSIAFTDVLEGRLTPPGSNQ